MSHLHKNRNAQINDSVPDLDKERDPEETAHALSNAMRDTEVRDHAKEVPADDVDAETDDDEEGDEEETPEGEMTKDELKAALDERGVEYPSKATKADLVELYNNAQS